MNYPSMLLRSALLGLVCLGTSVQAATIGYWRFENASSLGTDSSGNGLNLTSSSSVPASVSTPFTNPIPQTGASNLKAVDLEKDSSQYFSAADTAAFAVQDFTIESYIKLEAAGSSALVIASQMSTSTNSAWQFGVSSTGSAMGNTKLFIQLSSNGSTLVDVSSGWTITAGVNYYVAASVDITATDTKVTFYLQNLTNGGAMQSTTVTVALTSLYNSTSNFAIGTSYSGSSAAARYFDGAIDEVRLSNTALSQGSLLASVPEPSTYALAVAGVFAVVFARRRCVS